ncbi:hypothetical protein [Streptomyces sp. NPDC059753]|uniref:hypothetical protein n=1 Tax=Streptomyces sp. NPDC059753 TaxID=3346933 RepID=UPI00365094C3
MQGVLAHQAEHALLVSLEIFQQTEGVTTAMKSNSTDDESFVVGIVKREWASLQGNWKSWTKDMVKREYLAQIQTTGAKAEINGVAGSLTFLKLEHTIFDPIKKLEERVLASKKQLPEQLRFDIDDVRAQSRRAVDDIRNQASHAMDKAREVENKVTRLQRDHLSDLNDIADEFESVGNRVTGLINALGGL